MSRTLRTLRLAALVAFVGSGVASSIGWASALSHNKYDNNVSRITLNVLRRFLDPKIFS